MVFDDEGPSFEGPPQGNPHFRVSWTGLVSRTFSLWGRKLIQYCTIASIPIIINLALQAVILYVAFGALALTMIGSISTDPLSLVLSLFTSTLDITYLLVSIPLMIVSIVVSAVVVGGVIKLALDNYGAPDMGDARESISFAFSRIVTLIAVQLISTLIMVAMMLPGLILTIYAALTFDFLLSFLALGLMLIGLLFGLYLSVRLAPSTAVVIAEDKSAIDSIKRAWTLSSGQFGHIFAGTILLGIVVVIVGGIILIVSAPIILLGFGNIVLALTLAVAISAITGIFVQPLSSIFYAVLYKDLVERVVDQAQVW